MPRLPKLYLGTNTKMYKGIVQTEDFLTELGILTQDIGRDALELFVIPSFTALQAAKPRAIEGKITLGAQNMGWEDEGQFTGEISPLMLKEVGVQIAELGHSERRHVLMETDEQENKKLLCALRHGITPLLCVGETGAQKQSGVSDEVLRMQLKLGLLNVTAEQAKNIWVAYEPVWAIGVNGTPASKEYASEKHRVISEQLRELFGSAAEEIPVLYGGSVSGANAGGLIEMPYIDGLFIGRSAWNAQSFNKVIREVLPLFMAKP